MATKKRKTAKKPKRKVKVAKRKTKAVRKTNKRLTRSSGKKIGLVVKNLALFVSLAIASYLIQNVTTNQVANKSFILLTIIFGFISVAFFIVLLILLIMRGLKK